MAVGNCQIIEIVNFLTVKMYILNFSYIFPCHSEMNFVHEKEESAGNTVVDTHPCSKRWVQSPMSIFLSCPVLIPLSWPWWGVWTNGDGQPHHISHVPWMSWSFRAGVRAGVLPVPGTGLLRWTLHSRPLSSYR